MNVSRRSPAIPASGVLIAAGAVAALLSVSAVAPSEVTPATPAPAAAPFDSTTLMFRGEEKYLAHVRPLTHGGQNAEAYFSFDGKKIVFQSTRDGYPCDQIYMMNPDGSGLERISNGTGRTTCSFVFPDGKHVLFASTHLKSKDCPPAPDISKGYVWALYDYDLFVTRLGSGLYRRLTDHLGYDAEGTVSPDGKTVVFTSLREGDLDIYSMSLDDKSVKRLTSTYGFDGGPFISPDGKKIVYRGYHPTDPKAVEEYRELISKNLMKPYQAEIYLMNMDGSDNHALTSNGAANWAPAFEPGGNKIIFASNLGKSNPRYFDLYLINMDGSGWERVTFGAFNAFPYFSPDGNTLIFCSDRGAKAPHEFNVFAADWIGPR